MLKKVFIIASILCAMCTASITSASPEVREWTSINGNKVAATLVKDGGKEIVLQTTQGSKLSIGRHMLSRTDVEYLDRLRGQVQTTQEKQVLSKMKSTIIPELAFKQADIRDVVEFLKKASLTNGSKVQQSGGINMVLKLPSPSPQKTEAIDPFALALGNERKSSGVSLITWTAREVSLHDAISVICDVSGLKWSIKDSIVVIEKQQQ